MGNFRWGTPCIPVVFPLAPEMKFNVILSKYYVIVNITLCSVLSRIFSAPSISTPIRITVALIHFRAELLKIANRNSLGSISTNIFKFPSLSLFHLASEAEKL